MFYLTKKALTHIHLGVLYQAQILFEQNLCLYIFDDFVERTQSGEDEANLVEFSFDAHVEY